MTEYSLNESDTELLTRLLAADKAAFEFVVRSYHRPMVSIARAIVGEAQAEEAVQDAWLTTIRSLPKFEGRSSIKTWLFTIVANEAKSRLRRARGAQGRREVSLDEVPDGGVFDNTRWKIDGHWSEPPCLWHDSSPEALLSHDEFIRCLDTTLENLPDEQKAILTLREFQGQDMDTICNILEIGASNARVLIHRARLKVYAMVEHFEETGQC